MSARNLVDPTVRRASISLNPLALLDRVLHSVELTPTQYALAVQSYGAVTELLAKVGMPIEPYGAFLFSQGSMRLGTTVKPISKDVHDLDIMCLLRYGGVWLAPEKALDLIWDTLGHDETYRGMRERKCRCIRLIYKRQFNIDIVPGVPKQLGSDAPLLVPDDKLSAWFLSHPVGFADWFSEAAERTPVFITSFSANEGKVLANAQIEPLPEHGAFDKTPLQRITQLLKRDRDERFQKDVEHRPSSILLTTLAAHAYTDEVGVPATRLIEFVISVVARLHNYISVDISGRGPMYSVMNPVNSGENFAEKWDRGHYEAFRKWQHGLLLRLRAVADAKGKGIDVMLNRLSEGFGETRVLAAANELGADTSRLHQSGRLGVMGVTGFVGTSGAAMRATTYHGE